MLKLDTFTKSAVCVEILSAKGKFSGLSVDKIYVNSIM
jgi:hypothetical protein